MGDVLADMPEGASGHGARCGNAEDLGIIDSDVGDLNLLEVGAGDGELKDDENLNLLEAGFRGGELKDDAGL